MSIVLAAGLVFSGCSEKPDEVISEDPVLTPASDTVKISAEGGDCEIEYTLENSVAGGRIEASHEGDWISDLNYDVLGTAYYYGDFYSMGSCNWMVNIEPVSGTGDAIQLEINTSSMDFYEGIPTGTYSASAAGEALTFVPGYMENLNMFATWWFYYESGMIGSGYSPLTAGEITVVNNGDGTYKFDFFCFDDSPDYNLFTATWSGELELEGYYEGSAASRPVSKLNRLK